MAPARAVLEVAEVGPVAAADQAAGLVRAAAEVEEVL